MSRSERIAARRRLCWPALTLLFALAPHPAGAAVLLETNPDSTLTVTIQKIEGAPISLDEALRLALIQATRVREAEAAMRAARGALRHESGAFPGLILSGVRNRPNDDLSPKTAGNHIEHIYAKIDASSRSTATLFAMQHGMLATLEPVQR